MRSARRSPTAYVSAHARVRPPDPAWPSPVPPSRVAAIPLFGARTDDGRQRRITAVGRAPPTRDSSAPETSQRAWAMPLRTGGAPTARTGGNPHVDSLGRGTSPPTRARSLLVALDDLGPPELG